MQRKTTDTYVPVEDGLLFVRHTEIPIAGEAIIFIHGLGESGACFREAFESEDLRDFTLIAIDNAGYGKSGTFSSKDYCFKNQLKRIKQVITFFGLHKINIVGHSVGGDLGVLWCDSDQENRISSFVNIESDITQYDDFITRGAIKADKENHFKEWFTHEFMENLVKKQWGKQFDSCLRYYKSLKMCDPDAFKSNALELYELKNSFDDEFSSILGEKYAKLTIPTLFMYGSKSIDPRSITFLKKNNLPFIAYPDAGHWVMIDEARDCYKKIGEFFR